MPGYLEVSLAGKYPAQRKRMLSKRACEKGNWKIVTISFATWREGKLKFFFALAVSFRLFLSVGVRWQLLILALPIGNSQLQQLKCSQEPAHLLAIPWHSN